MPATTGRIGYGGTLLMDDGLGVYIALANVSKVQVKESFATIEATHLLSDNAYREYVPNLKDGGEVNITLQFDANHATHNSSTGLRKKFADRTLTNFRLVYPPANRRDNFSAYVTDVGRNVEVDSLMELEITLKISGPVTDTVHP